MDRRDLFARSGALLGAGALTSRTARALEALAAYEPDLAPADDWARVRAQFALDPALVHMSGFFLASHPRPVREAIERYRRELDANPIEAYFQKEERRLAAVRTAAARYLGGSPDDVALTDSTTMGLALLYGGLVLREGQEIVTTTHDHYSTGESLRFRAARTGAVIRRVPLYAVPERATEGEITGAVERAIGPRTRVVAVTWVHSSTGVKLPLRAIADVIARANTGRDEHDRVLLCVDGVHGFGAESDTPDAMGCDFFVAGCHKWLFGPRGTGIWWGRPEAWKSVRPIVPTFDDATYEMWMGVRPSAPRPPQATFSPGGFHSFEHRWALADAFAFHDAIGRPRITARIHALNRQLKDGLASMRSVTLHTPASDALSAGITTFEVSGLTPLQVVDRLRARGIVASVTPYRTLHARLAPGVLNTPDEVDRALGAVRGLTPLAGR